MMSRLFALLTCSLAILGFHSTGNAAFPDHPVHFVLGLAPGGGVDATTRLIATKLSEKWGQPVVVENKPGADGTIAADYVAHAAPDGYTIIMVVVSHVIPPTGYTLNYDPIKSFSPITRVLYSPDIFLVNPSVPVNSLKELIALAKSKPGQLNYGSTGTGTFQYLAMALMNKLAGIDIVNVTYKGMGPALVALLGNEVQAVMPSMSDSVANVKSGKLKAIAITGDTRSPVLPDVPTIRESVPGQGFIEQSPWYGILAPAGTPKEIQKKLSDDIIEALNSPNVQSTLTAQNFVIAPDSPEDFTSFLNQEAATWARLGKLVSATSK